MSIDFIVAISSETSSKVLAEFAASRFDVCLESQSDSESAFLLGFRADAGKGIGILVYGPFLTEPDDLDDKILAAVLAPKWSWQLTVPAAAPQKYLKLAKELCAYLSDKGKGVAFDPQSGKVFYPRGASAMYKAQSKKEETIDLIELTFMLPFSSLNADSGKKLMQILRKYCPSAVPVRFGEFEPFQGRMKSGDDKSFQDCWQRNVSIDFGGSFFWTASSPCTSGSISFSDRRPNPPNTPEGVTRKHDLSISFDGRALAEDPRWCEVIKALFVAIADRFGAFYAVCTVRRGVILARNQIWFGMETEKFHFSHGPWWMGIPTTPSWMTWFGRGYAEPISEHLKDCEYFKRFESGGLLIQMGENPMYQDVVKVIYPSLPEELVNSSGRGAELIPQVDCV